MQDRIRGKANFAPPTVQPREPEPRPHDRRSLTILAELALNLRQPVRSNQPISHHIARSSSSTGAPTIASRKKKKYNKNTSQRSIKIPPIANTQKRGSHATVTMGEGGAYLESGSDYQQQEEHLNTGELQSVRSRFASQPNIPTLSAANSVVSTGSPEKQ